MFYLMATVCIGDELHLSGIAVTGFDEELQITKDNSMGSIIYINWLRRGLIIIEGMDVSE